MKNGTLRVLGLMLLVLMILVYFALVVISILTRTIFMWGVLVVAELLVMAVMGIFYPYVSQWEKKKALNARLHRLYRPSMYIKERYSYKLVLIMAGLMVFGTMVLAFVSEEMREIIYTNPLVLNILCCLAILILHIFAFWVNAGIAAMCASLKIKYITKMYPSRYNVDIVNRTPIEPII